MISTCEIKALSTRPILFVRTRTAVQNLPMLIGQTIERIIGHIHSLGETPAGELFVAYFNMDMQDLDVQIGFTHPRPLEEIGDILSGTFPGGMAATCVYTGPYEKMVPAYDALNQCITANGAKPTGVAYEFYLNGPPEVEPEEFQTRIVLPLISEA